MVGKYWRVSEGLVSGFNYSQLQNFKTAQTVYNQTLAFR
jgi:hypothetical protein